MVCEHFREHFFGKVGKVSDAQVDSVIADNTPRFLLLFKQKIAVWDEAWVSDSNGKPAMQHSAMRTCSGQHGPEATPREES